MKTSKQNLITESSFLFGGQIYLMAANFILVMILTRILSVEDFGKFIFAQSIINTVIILGPLGLHRAIVQFTALHLGKNEWHKAKGVLFRLGGLSILTSTVLGLSVALVSYNFGDALFKHESMGIIVATLALTYPLRSAVGAISSFFMGTGKMLYPSLLQNISEPTLKIVFASGLILLPSLVLQNWVNSLLLIFVLNSFFAVWLYLKFCPPDILTANIGQVNFKKAYDFALPLMLSNMVILGINYADLIMLGFYGIPSDLGTYKVYKIMVSLLLAAISALGITYHPTITSLIGAGKDYETRETYNFVCSLYHYIGVLGFAVIVLWGPEMGRLLFGTDFSLQDPVLVLVLVIGPLISCLAGPNMMTLQAFGYTKLIMLNSITALFVLILISFILIPEHGMIGAAFATLFCYTIIHALGTVELYFLKRLHPFSRMSLKFIILSTIIIAPLIIAQYFFVKNEMIYKFEFTKFVTLIVYFIITYKLMPISIKNSLTTAFLRD